MNQQSSSYLDLLQVQSRKSFWKCTGHKIRLAWLHRKHNSVNAFTPGKFRDNTFFENPFNVLE